jgi:lysophospholipase L1-like esterase
MRQSLGRPEAICTEAAWGRHFGFAGVHPRAKWELRMHARSDTKAWSWLLILTSLGALGSAPARAAEPTKADKYYFQDGDIVVMMGDSITEAHLYSSYIEVWAVTRFPRWKLTFRNVGIGGDTSHGGNGRFQRDVARFRPTAITVNFGMNDGRYEAFVQWRFDNYVKGLQGIADQAKEAKFRVAWLTTQAVDAAELGKSATAAAPYNQTLERFADEGLKKIAEKNGGVFVDQFHPYLALLNRARGVLPKYAPITGSDPVHAGPPGQAFMAMTILKGLDFPTLVASVEIDATKKTGTARNATVNDVAEKDGGISFNQIDESLPFFPPEAEDILNWSPIRDDLNRYLLKVTGLKEGKYDIRLGGKRVTTCTAAELGQGVNLASAVLKAGPVADQVKAVTDAVAKKNDYFSTQILRVMRAKLPPDAPTEAIIKERLEEMPELDAAIRTTLKMKPHTVEVLPLK